MFYSIAALLRESAKRSIADQLAAEAAALERCASSDDFPEAIGAFMEKRPPRFNA